ncbi:hypothetical protein ACTXLS_08835 [Corynebacterium variabile]|uniref:hypothetical protein n=1 Tax=Corynebacterium variabile TaxID=1727 RepID=UPI003FD6A1EA
MTTTDNTSREFYTAPEIARRITVDREYREAVSGPGVSLADAAFTFAPAPFTRQSEPEPVTAEQIENLARTENIPTQVVGDPNLPRYVLYDWSAIREALGLSPVVPTAVRATTAEVDPDARPDDVDSIKAVSAKTGIDRGTIRALVDSGAVRDWAETREFMTSAAKPNGKKRAAMQSFTGYPLVSKAEVLAVAEHGLGL